ncbi:sensor domain-containing diguanylate cyclase [Desulfobaculum bizertense]|uniref:diguanylate cyclase n=1 Tax=Desulfobaculum bizertense DSM 18034 TaxID=1121442 RepID=A0A1T4WL50_9BACT|nr:sensor domain-containing diguanylate cyclase [Desulfobaculum bizertense]SKA78052.1 diguanylate cyclase (GGDEF) domain-containing protein [Desulfobaculum bizertense DSM 18034]
MTDSHQKKDTAQDQDHGPFTLLVEHYPWLFVLMGVLLVVATLILGWVDVSLMKQQIHDRETARLEDAADGVTAQINDTVSDVLFLKYVAQTALVRDQSGALAFNYEPLLRHFLDFSRVNTRYDQIRILSLTGQEVIRVNSAKGISRAVPPHELQDKSSRYYFQYSKLLKNNGLFFSPVDFNVEFGGIEVPFKPVFRLIVPIVGKNGTRAGYLAVNVFASEIYKEISARSGNYLGELCMLNDKGDWLYGAGHSHQWMAHAQDPGKSHQTFAQQYPEVWEHIQDRKAGHFIGADAFITFQTIDPRKDILMQLEKVATARNIEVLGVKGHQHRWYLLSVLSENEENSLLRKVHRSYVLAVIMVIVIVGIASLVTAQVNRKRIAFRERLRDSNKVLQDTLDTLNTRVAATERLANFMDSLRVVEHEHQVFEHIPKIAKDLFPGTSGCVHLLNPSSQLFECVSVWGEEKCQQDLYEKDSCRAIQSGSPYVVSRLATPSGICSHFQRAPKYGYICLPLIASGETLGGVTIELSPRTELMSDLELQRYIDEVRIRFTIVARHTALTVSNLRMADSLREQAIRDPLTGLFNRRHMEASLIREFSRAQRHGDPLGIMLLDVDHFKFFNDTYGHELGDEVLRKLGETLRTFCRREDIACRFGGEEFVLILPGASLDATARRAEELRGLVEHRMHVRSANQRLQVKISIGVSGYPCCAHDEEHLIATADAALYEAKQNGRNRVEIAVSVAEAEEEE